MMFFRNVKRTKNQVWPDGGDCVKPNADEFVKRLLLIM